LIATWAVDRVTKLWALDIPGVLSYAWLHFSLHHNPGAMLGLFADLPPVLRIVSLSTGGAFLVCTYALIQYLLPIKSLTLRTGMSILLGGILGNVTDRIIWGHVVDFIILGPPNMASPAFNLADALQWIGYGLIVTAIIRDGELLWPENNARKVYWINPHFQLKYCFLLLGVGLGISLVTMVFSYTYLRVTILELVGNNPILLDKFLIPFALTFTLVCIGFSVGLFAVGKIISHKIAGPIYAFEKYILEMTEAGKNPNELRNFKLRTKDEFKNLENLARHLRETMVRLQPGFDSHPEPEVLEPDTLNPMPRVGSSDSSGT
jgi:signal peptidase II